jgi:hypothetical protein
MTFAKDAARRFRARQKEPQQRFNVVVADVPCLLEIY